MEFLVAGRACGDCTVCCTVLALAALAKPSGVPCVNCQILHAPLRPSHAQERATGTSPASALTRAQGRGCAIHPTRPDACREFYCAWRMLEIFSEDWRPDRSGVFAQLEDDDIPAQFEQRTGIGLMLVGPHPAKTLRQRWFVDFVRTGVADNIPLFLSLPGPAGYQAAKLLLNDEAMRDAGDDSGRIKTALERALKRLQSHQFRKN